MSAYQNHASIPSRNGLSDLDARDLIFTLGDLKLEVQLDYDYEINGGEVTFYATQLNSDQEPHVVHAVYNDPEAFEKWVSDLSDMDAPAQVEEVAISQHAYDEAVQAGFGNWHRGVEVIRRAELARLQEVSA